MRKHGATLVALFIFAGAALIAACAVGRAATLLTFNVKHYKVVPGLVTAEPYTR